MRLTGSQIARMVDLSAVQAVDNEDTIRELVRVGLEYQVCLVKTLPVFTAQARELLGESSVVGLSGNVGFPDGGHTKAIIECHYLTDDQIRLASELCVQGGAAFVKTGTGWAPTGATVENVRLIKSVVGARAHIKASGGIRSLEAIIDMYRNGATRFGIGLKHAVRILEQCRSLPVDGIEI